MVSFLESQVVADAVDSDETDLVENVEVVVVALVKDQLQEDCHGIYVHRFQFSCLETTPLIRVQ